MKNQADAVAGCSLVGEYVDEGELPEAPRAKAEVERPRLVASYLDLWGRDDGTKEFTVLLRDRRTVTVRGHALKYLQIASNPTDCGSYGVLLRSGESEILVALFRVSEVTGVFSGNIRVSGESA
jgi:hypothetical protein